MQIPNRILSAIICIVLLFPISLHATEPGANSVSDVESYLNDIQEDNYSFTSSDLLTLDEEALEELSEFGIDLFDSNDELASTIIEYAAKYLGRPYVHGARGPKAFDCSGFTSYVFGQHGISLSPSSRTQATQGVKISTSDIRPGDLLFFSGRGGGSTVGHVAMAVDVDDNGVIKFIHASCSKGISYAKYPDGGYYSKRFIGARRVIE